MNDVRTRAALAILAVAAAAVAFAWLLRHPQVLPPKDFVEYWAAARVALDGGDPYDGDQLLPLQRWAADEPGRKEAVMMWNPPWSLPLYLPLAALDPRPAQLIWLGFQLALVVLACGLLWIAFGGPREHLAAVPLVALAFYGTLWTVSFGQNTGFLLFGLAGYLHFARRGRPALAGACAALTALKPHLLAPFGLLLVLDGFRHRAGARALLSGAATLALGLGIALAVSPDVLDRYLAATRQTDSLGATPPLSGWLLPQAAFHLRIALAPTHFWVQFVPCAIACAAYAAYFRHRRRTWDWAAELPAVVWVSVLTAPYGGWIFDLVVLLVPAVREAARLANDGRGPTIRLFAASYFALTAATFVFDYSLDGFYWVAPTTLLLGLAARAACPVGREPASGEPTA